jgi:hypothetical protein
VFEGKDLLDRSVALGAGDGYVIAFVRRANSAVEALQFPSQQSCVSKNRSRKATGEVAGHAEPKRGGLVARPERWAARRRTARSAVTSTAIGNRDHQSDHERCEHWLHRFRGPPPSTLWFASGFQLRGMATN